MGSGEATKVPLTRPCTGSTVGFNDNEYVAHKNMYDLYYFTYTYTLLCKYKIVMKIGQLFLKVYLNNIMLIDYGVARKFIVVNLSQTFSFPFQFRLRTVIYFFM